MPDQSATPARFRSWAGILAAALMTALIAAAYGFGVYLFAQLVPDMRQAFGLSYGFVGAVTAAGQMSFLASSLLTPWLVRRIGDTQVVIGSGAICAACLLGIGFAKSAVVLSLLLVVLAGMSASIWVPMITVMTRAVVPEWRGTALGLASAGTSYGVFVNSLLVPAFAPDGGWRMIWLITGGVTVLLTVISAIAFRSLGLFPAAQGGGAPSVQAEPRGGRTPLRPWIAVIWMTMFLLGLSNSPFQNYLSVYLRDELHHGIGFAAQVWGVIGFTGMFAGLLVGWLSDRIGLRVTMLLVYLSILVAAAIFALGMAPGFLLAAGVLFALAFYPIFGLVPAYVSARAESPRQAVTIFGVGNVSVGAGGMIGNYLGGVAGSTFATFVPIYAGIGLCAIGLIVLLACLPQARR